MTTSNTGGPAFPNPQIPHPGMTLRDWFAGIWLSGIVSNPNTIRNARDANIAQAAYQMADAMLAERAKEQQGTYSRAANFFPCKCKCGCKRAPGFVENPVSWYCRDCDTIFGGTCPVATLDKTRPD